MFYLMVIMLCLAYLGTWINSRMDRTLRALRFIMLLMAWTSYSVVFYYCIGFLIKYGPV